MGIRSCGCTYRDTGSEPMLPSWIERTEYTAEMSLRYGPMTWGTLCTQLYCRDYASRDELHRILHRIAVPTVTPESGPGRKGTTWHLPR